MNRYAALRASRPGLWLVAAVVTDVAVYATSPGRGASVWPWLALDLWLAYRTWNGGARALAWFRVLQVLGVGLFGLVLLISYWDRSLHTTAGPVTVLLLLVSAWSLLAPALSRHVAMSHPLNAAS